MRERRQTGTKRIRLRCHPSMPLCTSPSETGSKPLEPRRPTSNVDRPARSPDWHRKLEVPPQFQTSSQRSGLSPTCARGHRLDEPKADLAPTFITDHPSGAVHDKRGSCRTAKRDITPGIPSDHHREPRAAAKQMWNEFARLQTTREEVARASFDRAPHTMAAVKPALRYAIPWTTR